MREPTSTRSAASCSRWRPAAHRSKAAIRPTLAYQHVHATPERADTLVPQVPAALASTIDRSMAKDPADRPAERRRTSPFAGGDCPVDRVRRRGRSHATVDAGGRDRRPSDGPAAFATVAAATAPAIVFAAPLDRRVVLGVALLLVLNAIYGGADPTVDATDAGDAPISIAGVTRPSPAPSHAIAAVCPTRRGFGRESDGRTDRSRPGAGLVRRRGRAPRQGPPARRGRRRPRARRGRRREAPRLARQAAGQGGQGPRARGDLVR